MPKVSAKGKVGTRTCSYAQKNQKVQVVVSGNSGVPWVLMCATGLHLEWNIEAMDEKKIGGGGDASEANDENQDTISILSDISEEEECPIQNQHHTQHFCRRP